jgi:hypothetical protein
LIASGVRQQERSKLRDHQNEKYHEEPSSWTEDVMMTTGMAF